MTSTKYIGMDVHKESISMAVRNATGKIVMECVIETKASIILQFLDGLRGDLYVTCGNGCVRFRRLVRFEPLNCWAFCRLRTGSAPSGSYGPIAVWVW
jgi:hypothetical protein